MAPINSWFVLANRLLIIVVVLSFSVFPKVLLTWLPLRIWIILFLTGIAVLGALEMRLRYKQGVLH